MEFNFTKITELKLKKFMIILVLVSVLILTALVKWLDRSSSIRHHQLHQSPVLASDSKTILLWNSFWGSPYWEIGPGQDIFRKLNCGVQNCNITQDRGLLNTSSAVLFHIHELGGITPPLGNPLQKRVFFMLESPAWSKNNLYRSKLWSLSFHWTMTYRLDSTIPIPYGSIKRRIKSHDMPLWKSLEESYDKRKLMAAMSSNCNTPSKRSRYIKALGQHIDIDHYGRCGDMSCQRDINTGDVDCLTMLNSTYKFYLAFENALCKDYATEKFFKILPLNVVPVVRSRADYFWLGTLKWFIDTRDFASPKALAKYLLRLSDHPLEYARYLQNRELYELKTFYGLGNLDGWCQLCELVHNKRAMVRVDTVDVGVWWDSQKDCVQPSDVK